MPERFADRAESTLAAGIAAGATSLTVASGQGSKFPATGDFSILLQDASVATTFELVKATARSGDTITVSPTVLAWDTGDKVVQVLDKRAMDAVRDQAGRTIRKTANESVTSSTTMQDDDQLLFPIGTNEVWQAEFVVFVAGGDVAGDIRVGVAGPAGSTVKQGTLGLVTGVTNHEGDVKAYGGGPVNIGISTTETVILILVTVVNGATAGNVVLQWAQTAASATATTVQANSCVSPRRIA